MELNEYKSNSNLIMELENSSNQNDLECMICLEPINEDLLQLSCKCIKSFYHTKCITKWYNSDRTKNNKCLCCYKDFTLNDQEENTYQISNLRDRDLLEIVQVEQNYFIGEHHLISISNVSKYLEISIVIVILICTTNTILFFFLEVKNQIRYFSLCLSTFTFITSFGGLIMMILHIKKFIHQTRYAHDLESFSNIINVWDKEVKWITYFINFDIFINCIIFYLSIVDSFQKEVLIGYCSDIFILILYMKFLCHYPGIIKLQLMHQYIIRFGPLDLE